MNTNQPFRQTPVGNAIGDKMFSMMKNLVSDSLPESQVVTPGQSPSRAQILTNRRQFGVNFGSCFVQEKYIFDRFFGRFETEFEGVSSYVAQRGIEQTRADLQRHWLSYAGDADWNWLRDHGVTSIRVPVGYWHVGDGQFTRGTPFEQLSPVYSGAWGIFKQMCSRANEYDIGVLFDLHALPGGANNSDHNGVKIERVEFWGNNDKSQVYSLLEFVARELQPFENVIGIQVVNESEFSNDAKYQKEYYTEAIKTIRKVDSVVPVIISDGWWTDQWCQWLKELKHGDSCGVIIDAHIYRCFSDADKGKSAQQIVNDLDKDCLTGQSHPCDVMVGEYSCVLDEKTWKNSGGAARSQLVHAFGQTLSQLFMQRASMGSYFWTYKFQNGDGGEWGFVPMVEQGCIPTRPHGVVNLGEDDFNRTLGQLLQQHTQYWDSRGGNYEHWRYSEGFTTGWADSRAFSALQGSTVGRRAWVMGRLKEHVSARGAGQTWEWEQGYYAAVGAYH